MLWVCVPKSGWLMPFWAGGETGKGENHPSLGSREPLEYAWRLDGASESGWNPTVHCSETCLKTCKWSPVLPPPQGHGSAGFKTQISTISSSWTAAAWGAQTHCAKRWFAHWFWKASLWRLGLCIWISCTSTLGTKGWLIHEELSWASKPLTACRRSLWDSWDHAQKLVVLQSHCRSQIPSEHGNALAAALFLQEFPPGPATLVQAHASGPLGSWPSFDMQRVCKKVKAFPAPPVP